MTVGEITIFGAYTVRCSLRFDNPFWPRYVIYRGDRLIGAQFSMPNLDDCRSHETRRREKVREIREARLGRSDGYSWRGRLAALRNRRAA